MKGPRARGIWAKFDLKRIMSRFDDDPIAQTMLMGMADGTRGEELRSKRLEPDGVREQAKENSQTHREVKDVSNKDVKQDALDNLADALTEDILNTPDDELFVKLRKITAIRTPWRISLIRS